MSQDNVRAFRQAAAAFERRDADALLEVLAADVEWHPALQVEGAATVYNGHEGVRQLLRNQFEIFAQISYGDVDVRDLGDRVVAVGRLRTRGRGSGALTESPFGLVVDFQNGKVIQVRSYLDPDETLEAAGLSE